MVWGISEFLDKLEIKKFFIDVKSGRDFREISYVHIYFEGLMCVLRKVFKRAQRSLKNSLSDTLTLCLSRKKLKADEADEFNFRTTHFSTTWDQSYVTSLLQESLSVW